MKCNSLYCVIKYTVIQTYTKQKEKLNEKLNEMYKTERDIKNKNKKADEEIDQMTSELTELKSLIDYGLNDKLMHHSREK